MKLKHSTWIFLGGVAVAGIVLAAGPVITSTLDRYGEELILPVWLIAVVVLVVGAMPWAGYMLNRMTVAKRFLAGLRGATREVGKAHEREQQQAAAPQPPVRPEPGTPEAAMWEFRDLMYAAGVSEADFEEALQARYQYGLHGNEVEDLTSLQNNKLYFDDQRDQLRQQMRELVFGIQDKEARKKIIAKRNEAGDLFDAERRSEVAEMRRTAAQTQRRLSSGEGWVGAAVNAAIFVAVGYWLFNIAGAIGGAVVGFFLGQGQVHRVRTRLTEEAQQAEKEWKETVQEDEEDARVRPAFFSASEARTGEEDTKFGNESAFENRVQLFRRRNQAGS